MKPKAHNLTTHTMIIDEVTFTYHVIGGGRPMVLIPALHIDVGHLAPMLEYLAQFFTVYIPELPGVGNRETLGTAFHSSRNYARYLVQFVNRLGLENYLLTGICLGAIIVVYMLDDLKRKPSYVVLFESVYDGAYIRLPALLKALIFLLKTLGPSNRILFRLGDFFLHNKTFLTLYFRFVFRKEKNLDTIVPYQITLTDQANTRTYMELVYDLFTFHFDPTRTYSIATFLIFNAHDDLFDTKAMMAGMNRIFPKATVLVTDFRRHAPLTQIDESLVNQIMKPLVPYMKKLSQHS